MTDQAGFAAVNGTRLYYEASGSGPALVFLHAFASDQRLWDAQVAHFARRYRVVRYDARGYGKSDVPSGTPYAHGEDLRALLDHLEIPQAILCGASMGGQNAIELTLRHPRRVRALVVASTSLQGFPFSRETIELFTAMNSAARSSGVAAAKSLFLASDLIGTSAEAVRPMVTDYSGWHWLNDSPVIPLTPPMMQRLSEIAAPTLATISERDPIDPHRAFEYFTQHVPSAKRHTFTGVGHFANLEAPGEFNAQVEEFLRGVGA